MTLLLSKIKAFLKIEFNPERIFGLDLLRAIAIFTVMLYHGIWIVPEGVKNIIVSTFIDGVTLFFVLSGYLIGGIIIKKFRGDIGFRGLLNFWIRRWFRTLPLYYIVLTILILIYNPIDTDFYKYYLFIQNLNTVHPNFFMVAWSLAVEEWFYLLIPLLFFFLINYLKIPPKSGLLLLIISIIILSLGIRSYQFYSFDISTLIDWDKLIRKQVITRMDSIIIGVLAAWINYYYLDFWLKHKKFSLLCGILLLLLSKMLDHFEVFTSNTLFYSLFMVLLLSLSIFLMLPFLSSWKKSYGLLAKLTTYISIISYSMYLIHTYIIVFVIGNIPFEKLSSHGYFNQGIGFIAYFIFTYIISLISYKIIEKPILSLRERISMSKKTRQVSI